MKLVHLSFAILSLSFNILLSYYLLLPEIFPLTIYAFRVIFFSFSYIWDLLIGTYFDKCKPSFFYSIFIRVWIFYPEFILLRLCKNIIVSNLQDETIKDFDSQERIPDSFWDDFSSLITKTTKWLQRKL